MSKTPRNPALPEADEPIVVRPPLTYLVADNYRIAMDYARRADLSPIDYRYVSQPEVLRGTKQPKVIVIGDGSGVSNAIVDALARKNAEVTYV